MPKVQIGLSKPLISFMISGARAMASKCQGKGEVRETVLFWGGCCLHAQSHSSCLKTIPHCQTSSLSCQIWTARRLLDKPHGKGNFSFAIERQTKSPKRQTAPQSCPATNGWNIGAECMTTALAGKSKNAYLNVSKWWLGIMLHVPKETIHSLNCHLFWPSRLMLQLHSCN